MKRRLRKKKLLGEFAVHGFACRFRFQPPLPPAEAGRFAGEFRALIDRHGLCYRGGGDPAEWAGVVRHRDLRESATQAHREILSAWLNGQPNIREIKIGRLQDVNYGPLSNGHAAPPAPSWL